jgi:hypothetical protein
MPNQLHEHSAIDNGGGYSADYPGTPDPRQGMTVDTATVWIDGDTYQLPAVPNADGAYTVGYSTPGPTNEELGAAVAEGNGDGPVHVDDSWLAERRAELADEAGEQADGESRYGGYEAGDDGYDADDERGHY